MIIGDVMLKIRMQRKKDWFGLGLFGGQDQKLRETILGYQKYFLVELFRDRKVFLGGSKVFVVK